MGWRERLTSRQADRRNINDSGRSNSEREREREKIYDGSKPRSPERGHTSHLGRRD